MHNTTLMWPTHTHTNQTHAYIDTHTFKVFILQHPPIDSGTSFKLDFSEFLLHLKLPIHPKIHVIAQICSSLSSQLQYINLVSALSKMCLNNNTNENFVDGVQRTELYNECGWHSLDNLVKSDEKCLSSYWDLSLLIDCLFS